MLIIDGSHGEGGGQVLRTSLALSAVTGRPVRIERIRAGRRRPGLMPQHLTSVRAIAKCCDATVEGDALGSQTLSFAPGSAPRAGIYTFDVSNVAREGSAGSVTLILQTVLLPLALARGPSQLTLRGGTHVAWSPPFDYLKRVYLPTLARIGIAAKIQIERWGWYPVGGGEIRATVQGRGRAESAGQNGQVVQEPGTAGQLADAEALPGWTGLDLGERGARLRVRGMSASSNLPKHVRTRQEGAALQALRAAGVNARIDLVDAPSKGIGTALFLWAEFENSVAGFTSLGERGKPAEAVAEEAAVEMLRFLDSAATVDRYLADQVLLPLALAEGPSYLTAERITQHLLTNAWVVNQFFAGRVEVEGAEGQPGACRIGGSR